MRVRRKWRGRPKTLLMKLSPALAVRLEGSGSTKLGRSQCGSGPSSLILPRDSCPMMSLKKCVERVKGLGGGVRLQTHDSPAQNLTLG